MEMMPIMTNEEKISELEKKTATLRFDVGSLQYKMDMLFKAVYGSKDEPWMKSPCETCANKGDHDGECRNCVADSEVIRWKKPSHYEPKDEPQTEDEILREQCRAFMGIVEQTEREGE